MDLVDDAYLALDARPEVDDDFDYLEGTLDLVDSPRLDDDLLLDVQLEEETDVSFRFPPTSDPLEDKITSTRNGQDEVLSSVSQFASILSQTGIHGPRHLQAHNLTRQAVRIGRGTQFTVFRRLPDLVIGEAEDVVIKRVNVALSRDESNAKSFAASPEYRQQLRALELELLSLCNPRLRGHRNIVHLVAWGYDYPIPDTPVPILFVEAALLPLSDFLKPENRELLGNQPDDVKYQLALDTVAGIEALHSLSIVHGDIKPDNILVFRQTAGGGGKVPFCAKISDFGVCLNLETRQSSLVIEDYRGTPGWLPPEIQDEDHRWTSRQKFAPEVMLRFDSYSLGLLILSVFVSDGQLVDLEVDGEEPVEAAIDLLRGQTSLVSALRMQLGKALRAFLAIDPWERALPSPDLLKTDTPAFASWLSVSQLGRGDDTTGIGTLDPVYNRGTRFWYRLDESVINELEREYAASLGDSKPSPFAPDVLFGLAQSIAARRMDPNAPPYLDRMITYVTESARRGYSPARAVYAQIMHAHGRIPEFSEQTLHKWTLQAISEGCLFANPSSRLSPEDLEAARQKFRDVGGFCTDAFLQKQDIVRMIRDVTEVMERQRSGRRIVDNVGNTLLHASAALGALDVVRALIEEAKIPVDVMNDNSETPLYKACQAGHVSVINYLIDQGAKAFAAAKKHKLTALHWLFTIPEHSVREVAGRLVREAGADVNALIVPEGGEIGIDQLQSIPMVHFPFELPFGTPLHWAAFARNKCAIGALLDLGAEINATYLGFDAGTTPLAMAVWYGELDIVQLLLSKGADGTAKDSKGRNSLHAMTFYSPERHGCLTYPWHYWIRHGNWDEHLQRKNGLTKVLVDAGADLEELDRVYPRSTPLMLASDEKDGGATCALLNAGADANGAREGSGNTVLHEWARKPAFSLDYPESYLYVFKRIADATSDANVRNSYDKEGPLHFLVNAAHTREDARKGLDILLTHRPPADINLTNRRGETALYIAFDTGHLKQGREERALDLVDAGASLFTHRDDGRDIIFPVANNKGLHDADSLQLIRRLLSHVAEAENTTIVQAYQRHFLSHSGSILALSAAASGGRVETTKFLLDLGLSTRLNQPFKDPGGGNRSPPCTVLDTTLAAAIYTRQLHMDRLARFSPGAARDRALASNAVYDAASSSQGSPARAAEAYAGLPAVLRELRSRGAKRACELDPIPDPAVLKMDKMGAENHPDLWDVMIMYSLGFTPRTQPNRKRQAIVYELARYPTDWREQLVEVLWWMHQFVWLPHLNMLKDAVRVVRGHDENPSVSPAGSTNNNDIVVDVEFLRKMLAMLFEKGRKEPSTKVIDFSALSLDDQDQQQQTASTSSWIEVTEALKYGSGAELNSSTNHLVEVELLEGGIKIGEVRRTLREGDGI